MHFFRCYYVELLVFSVTKFFCRMIITRVFGSLPSLIALMRFLYISLDKASSAIISRSMGTFLNGLTLLSLFVLFFAIVLVEKNVLDSSGASAVSRPILLQAIVASFDFILTWRL